MRYQPHRTRSRFQTSQNPAQSQQQPIQTPLFEANLQAPTVQGEPTAEAASPRALSPFEVQQRTIGQPTPIPSANPSPEVPQSPPQVASSPSQPTPQVQQFPIGFGAAVPQSPPAQIVQARGPQVATPQTVGPMTGVPQQSIPQTSGSPTAPGRIENQAQQAAHSQARFSQEPSTEFTPRMPPLDIHDAGESLELEVELPGVSKKNIRLVSQPQGLELSATAEERNTDDLVQSERGQRVFQRSIPVGFEVDPQEVSARFENGILTVSIPKEAAKGGNTIEIK